MVEEYERKSWEELGEGLVHIMYEELEQMSCILYSELKSTDKFTEFKEIEEIFLHNLNHLSKQPRYQFPKEMREQLKECYTTIRKKFNFSEGENI